MDETTQDEGPVYEAPLLDPDPDPDVTPRRETGGAGG